MKGKYISALVGIGAVALFAVPGAASASTMGFPKPMPRPVPGIRSCASLRVPWYDQGKEIWVLEGYGRDAHCVLVPIHALGHPIPPGHSTPPGYPTGPGHSTPPGHHVPPPHHG
jgi:hypothetical protein